MVKLLRRSTWICLIFFSFATFGRDLPSGDISGFVEVAPHESLFYRLYKGTTRSPRSGKIVVFENGLTQDTEHWAETIPEVLKTGASVLLYDPILQGQSLKKFAAEEVLPWPYLAGLRYLRPLLMDKNFVVSQRPQIPSLTGEQQADQLALLLKKLNVRQPIDLVGLSRGGGVGLEFAAKYSSSVRNLIAVAPYAFPMPSQDELIREILRRSFHVDESNPEFEEYYDYVLRVIVLSTYAGSEPTALKWGPIQLLGIASQAEQFRHQQTERLVKKLPPHSFTLVVAGDDSYIPRAHMHKLWHLTPVESRRAIVVVEGVEHKINESVGPYLGGLIAAVVTDRPEFSGGHAWVGHPEKGTLVEARSHVRLELPQASICENLLLRPAHPGGPSLPIDRIMRDPSDFVLDAWVGWMGEPYATWARNSRKYWSGF